MPRPKLSRGVPVWVRKRIDAKAPEIEGDAQSTYKDRPWLVLSNVALHQRLLFIAPPMTTAKERTVIDLCVLADPPRKDLIDVQQVWTFPIERAVSDEWVPIGPDAVHQTRSRLREYLSYAAGPRDGWLCQGRIVWLRLVPAEDRILAANDPSLKEDTDFAAWQASVRRLLGFELGLPEDWKVPAVVVTNDRYLPNHERGPRVRGIYPLVTVVPMVHAPPELLTRGAPQIPGPRGSIYAPLTQCLLTLAFDAAAADGAPGLIPNSQGFGPACVDDQTRRLILDEVFYSLGLGGRD